MRVLICVILLCLLCLPAFAPIHAQNGDPPIPIVDAPTARPRILITQSYIDQVLHPRMERNEVSWQNLLAYVNSAQPQTDVNEHPDQVMRSFAIAYLMTGEQRFAQQAMDGLLRMVQRIESHPVMRGEGVWDMQFVDDVAGVAVGYDWLYNTFTTTDRTALKNVLLRAADVLNNPAADNGRVYVPFEDGTYRFAAFDHYGLRVVWAVTAAGMALFGEEPRAADLMDYANNLFSNWIIPALESQPGGAWAEGPYYGFLAHRASIQTAVAWWTAQGINYFDNTQWWYDRLAYDLFLTQPAVRRVGDNPSGMAFWNYPAAIGDTLRYSNAALFGRANDLMLTTIFSGSEYADWQHWLFQQDTDALRLQDWMAVEAFLWHVEDAEGIPAPWLFWYTQRTGHVLMRSNWTDSAGHLDQDAVTITFHAGDHFAYHQTYDQGGITISRGGFDLLVKSGVFSETGNTDHDANYAARTIAANTLLICDFDETFDEIRLNDERNVWFNDCGQRPVFPHSGSAINTYFLEDNPRGYETGAIVRSTEEGGMNYFRADLTAAYNSTSVTVPGSRPKVQEVLRELVYLRPGTLLVYDRILTTEPDFTPLQIFHLPVLPEQSSDWLRVAVGDSQLSIAGINPRSRAQIVEGYEVAGQIIPSQSNAFEPPDYGQYRVQFSSQVSGTSHFFLTLLLAEDVNAGTPPAYMFVEGESVVGAAWEDWQIMFDDDAGNLSAASFDVQPGAVNVLVIGLAPLGSYRVIMPNGIQQNLLADDAGTLYLFLESPGRVQISQAN